MDEAPKVTGLSPMAGPPGTKITVRGENLGQSGEDITSLTVNGADCLPYLEWKSSKKIITRCTKAFGNGDIIVTTKSGGLGTCDVQFNCYKAIVGPTEESAVWVEAEDYQVPEKEQLTILGTNEECRCRACDFSSNQFKPHVYLLHHHSNASLDELERLRSKLKEESKNPQAGGSSLNRAALLKSNLPTIMESLQILERLSREGTASRDSQSCLEIVGAISNSLGKTHELFDPLLAQRDVVQLVESLMPIFKQNEAFLNLPAAIASGIETKNYDPVVNDISGVLSRLRTLSIEPKALKKMQLDVMTEVNRLRDSIEDQLLLVCKSTSGERNIDGVKRLIRHLNRLGSPVNYDIWHVVKVMSDSLLNTLSDRHKDFLRSKKTVPDRSSQNYKPPYVVFVEAAMSIFQNTYYDILALGQAYFDPKDEFACKLSDDRKQANLEEFKDMITRPIHHLCGRGEPLGLLRSTLVPETSDFSDFTPDRSLPEWIKHILNLIITCQIRLTKVNLPPVANPELEDFKHFVGDLRIRFMEILFINATHYNKNHLHEEEDWSAEVDDIDGCRTKLPTIFENNFVATIKFVNDTIFKTSPVDEKSILEKLPVQATMKECVLDLVLSFVDSLDKALADQKEHLAESRHTLAACRKSATKYTNRLLITICNCEYTKNKIFGRLQDKSDHINMEQVFRLCNEKYSQYIERKIQEFCKKKYHELTAVNRNERRNVLNLMSVQSQIFLMAPQLVDRVMRDLYHISVN